MRIVGDQRKAQKPPVLDRKAKAKSLEEASLLKASPKSRWKVCRGENFSIDPVFYLFFHSLALILPHFTFDRNTVSVVLE